MPAVPVGQDPVDADKMEHLMKKSSDLQIPDHLLPYESLNFSTDSYYLTNFDILKRNEFIPPKSQSNLTILKNVNYYGDNIVSPEPDPYATDHDSSDPDFIPIHEEMERHEDNEEGENQNHGKLTKIKRRCVETWRRSEIKESRNTGKEYINWKGNLQSERKLKPPCKNCRKKCAEKLSEEDRRNIFTNFWELGDINRQRDFISKFVATEEKKRHRQRKKTKINVDENSGQGKRNYTFNYYLPSKGKSSSVCKTFFLNTLSISGQMVRTVVSKLTMSGVVIADRRGRARKNSALDESVKDSVRHHINAFETVESHYCRKSTQKKYLPATLNVARMYSLYLEYCQEKNMESVATESIYRQIFNTEFNLSFFVPKKDLCDYCHNYENAENKAELEEGYQQHQRNKELSRKLKNDAKDFAKNEPHYCTAVFDLQQVLPVPKSNVGLTYYKLKLSTYNFTVYNLSSKECDCFMWYECIARRGSSEIGSCLLKFIKAGIDNSITEFSFFSDNCSGQNRNKFLFAFYSYASMKFNIKIRHTYLEAGHTQSEGDSVHSVIEKAARNIPIYTPEQWYSVVRTAKKKRPLYTVHEISQEVVFDLKNLQSKIAINFDKDEDNNKVLISKFKIIEFNPEFPFFLFFKTGYEDDQFRKLNLAQRGRKRLSIGSINDIDLVRLYPTKLPLTKKKYDHLQFLCAKGVISQVYHEFFKDLPFTTHQMDEEDNEQ